MLAKAKASYRERCRVYAETYAAPQLEADGSLELRLVFFPPDRRHYDLDNLHARMKAGLDGLCDALEINDRRFRPVTVDRMNRCPGGRVLVHLSW